MKHLLTTAMIASIAMMGCQKAQDTQVNEATQNTAQPETIKITADEPVTTPSGAQFMAYKGWKMTKLADGLEFKSPEGSVNVHYYELSAKDLDSADDAIDEAFKRYSQNIPYKMKSGQLNEYQNIKGYDVIAQKEYINLENMNIAINAVKKHDDKWYAFVMGGRQDAFKKRANQAQTMYDTFKRADEIAQEEADTKRIASLKPRLFDEKTAAAMDSLIQKHIDVLGTPGAAVAIVQNGKVVHAKGYGKRIYGQDLPVTEKTLFPIGSASKMFTSYLAAEAVRQGKIQWDTPIYTLLPEFVTKDKEYTQQITIKHALSMTSGLPRRDFTWGFRNDDAAGVLKEMAHMPSVMQPGTRYIYCNHGVASAGYAIARTLVPEGSLDDAWKKAMQTIVLDPLGMTSSTYDLAKVQTMEYAAPTAHDIQLQLIPTPMSVHEHLQGYAPAGALWSNAEDLGKFMVAELANQDPVHAKRWEPAVHIADNMQYGLGFFMEQENGLKTRHHGGAITGAKAQITFYPEQNFAIAIMTNDGLGLLNTLIESLALEIIFQSPDKWVSNSAKYLEMLPTLKDIVKTESSELTKDLDMTPDAAWLESLVGKYHGKELGDVEIAIVNGKGIMKTPYWESEFGRKNEDGKDMLIMLQFPYPGLMNFEVKKNNGNVTELVMIEDQKIVKYEYTLKKQ